MSEQLLKEVLDALQEIHDVATVKHPEDPGTFGQRLLKIEHLAENLLVQAGRLNPAFAQASHACHFRTGEGKVPLNMEEGELKVLDHTAAVWNAWLALGEKHPGLNTEVCTAIHDIQFRVAFRVARRTAPNVWTQEPKPASPRELMAQAVLHEKHSGRSSNEMDQEPRIWPHPADRIAEKLREAGEDTTRPERDPEQMMAELLKVAEEPAEQIEFPEPLLAEVREGMRRFRARWLRCRNLSEREDCAIEIGMVIDKAAESQGIQLGVGSYRTHMQDGTVTIKTENPWLQQLMLRLM